MPRQNRAKTVPKPCQKNRASDRAPPTTMWVSFIAIVSLHPTFAAPLTQAETR